MNPVKQFAQEMLNDLKIIHDFIMDNQDKKAIFHLGMLIAATYRRLKEEEAKEPKNDNDPAKNQETAQPTQQS